MMKRNYLLIVVAFICFVANASAQSPDWQYAIRAGGIDDDFAECIVVDVSGNRYVTGCFISAAIIFGTDTIFNALAGNRDVFIVKYDATGNALWARSAGGLFDDAAVSVAVDTLNNCFVTGYFNSSNIIFGLDTLDNAGTRDMFVVKYDAGGNAVWAKSAGGNSADEGTSIAADDSGNTYLTGSFASALINFDTDTFFNTNPNFTNMFVVKYDTSGNVLWAKDAGGPNNDNGRCIAVDDSGNSYVGGFFESPVISFGSFTLTDSSIGSDMFIVKYDAGGNVIWANFAGGNGIVEARSVDTDANGNTFVTGTYSSPVLLFNNDTLHNAGVGEDDMYLVKFDAGGNVLWSRSAGGTSDDPARCVVAGTAGSCYIVGYFKSTDIIFGNDTLTNTSGSDDDLFVVSFDNNGNVLWSKSAGGSGSDRAHSIAVDASENIYVAGYFDSPTLVFDADTLINAGTNKYDIFIAMPDNTTGTGHPLEHKESVLIYPNPATHQFTIILRNELEKADISITDVTGKIMYESKAAEVQKVEVNTEHFANGFYFIRIQATNFMEVKKLIVVK